MGQFEKYIKNKRDEFDTYTPENRDNMWDIISASVDDKNKSISAPDKGRVKMTDPTRMWKYAFIAASLLIAFMAGYMINSHLNTNNRQLIFVNMDSGLAKKEAELISIIQNYSALVRTENKDLYGLATTPEELEEIDNLINIYNTDLQLNGPNKEIEQSIIDLYKKKILILQRMLNEIKKQNETVEISI